MRLFRLISLIAILCLIPLTLHADTYTYLYTGNPFTTADSPFTTSEYVTGELIFSAPLAPNLTDAEFYSFGGGYFTDGLTTFSPYLDAYAELSTDAIGDITSWYIIDEASPSIYTITAGGLLGSGDSVAIDVGTPAYASSATAGTWTSPTLTPEPSSIALLATGLLTAAPLIRRRLS